MKQELLDDVETKCCRQNRLTKGELDKIFVSQLGAYNDRLYDNIELHKRARANWHKLRFMVNLYRLCGGDKEKILK